MSILSSPCTARCIITVSIYCILKPLILISWLPTLQSGQVEAEEANCPGVIVYRGGLRQSLVAGYKGQIG